MPNVGHLASFSLIFNGVPSLMEVHSPTPAGVVLRNLLHGDGVREKEPNGDPETYCRSQFTQVRANYTF
jgi:hypothetical protein